MHFSWSLVVEKGMRTICIGNHLVWSCNIPFLVSAIFHYIYISFILFFLLDHISLVKMFVEDMECPNLHPSWDIHLSPSLLNCYLISCLRSCTFTSVLYVQYLFSSLNVWRRLNTSQLLSNLLSQVWAYPIFNSCLFDQRADCRELHF
jgi:hypothetical protein